MASDVFGLVGETLEGRYRLLSVVGAGGFGVVYRAEHVTFEAPVAVKVLQLQSHLPEAQERLKERFRDEAVLLQRLGQRSPGIVRIVDFGFRAPSPSQSQPYLVMEWLDGRSLDQALAALRSQGDMPLSEQGAVDMLTPAIEALVPVHRGDAGVVVAHRDIKPQNLFVLRDGGMKVLDLGIAKVMQPGEGVTFDASQTSSGFGAFSPLYGAPEQFHPRRFGQTGPWTDVHALALVLVEMVSGRRALDGDDYPTCFVAATAADRPTPRSCGARVSDGFEQICAKALSLDPRERFATAGDLLKALRSRDRAPSVSTEAMTIDELLRAAALETSRSRRARLQMSLGARYLAEQGDRALAAASFEAALRDEPGWVEPLDQLVPLLTEAGEWKGLARAYRTMLAQLSGKDDRALEQRLWRDLGLLYRDRMGEPDKAAECLSQVVRLAPDEASSRQALAVAYEKAGAIDRAIEQHEEAFRRDSRQASSLHALYQIYSSQKAHDPAWCVSAVLCSLGEARDGERRFFDDFKPRGLLAVRARLDDSTWKSCLHTAEVGSSVTAIFEALAPAAQIIKGNESRLGPKPTALARALRQDPKTTRLTFAKALGWVASVLGVGSPELYVDTGLKEALVDVVHGEPLLLAGQKVLVASPEEQIFLLARHLTRRRPGFLTRVLFPSFAELTALLMAGIQIARPSFSPPENKDVIARVAAALSAELLAPQRERLEHAVRVFFDEGAKVSFRPWLEGIDRTGARAGLLLTADPAVARRALESVGQAPGGPTLDEQMRDLLGYAVSRPYFEARKAIGVSLG